MYRINNPYDIDDLVNRFSEKYIEITGSLGGKAKASIKRPEIQPLNRKVYIHNFRAVCTSMNRDSIEVSNYIAKELKIQTSISGDGTLIIHGSYRKNKIEDIVKKYIVNFVQCLLCRAHDTIIKKVDKISYIICNKCHGSNSISKE